MADSVTGRHCWDQAGKGRTFWSAVELVCHSSTFERGRFTMVAGNLEGAAATVEWHGKHCNRAARRSTAKTPRSHTGQRRNWNV